MSVDERKGLPSASSLDAEMRCLGRRNLNRKHEAQIEVKKSKDGESGTKIHKVLEGALDIEELTASEKWTVAIIMNQEAEMVEKYGFEGSEVISEKRMWYVNDEFQQLFSGRVDRVHLLNKSALIIDYKSGFSYTVPLDNNWQIKAQAVLVGFESGFSIDRYVCGLVHPHHPESLREEIIFTANQVEFYAKTIEIMTEKIKDPDAPRTPNPVSCLRCQAKKFCSEYQMMFEEQTKKADPEKMTPKERGERAKWVKMAQKELKMEEEIYKIYLKRDPLSVLGWRLSTSMNDKCLDMPGFIEKAKKEYGEKNVNPLLELSKTDLIKFEQEKSEGGKKLSEKKAKENIDINFRSFFKKIPKEASLKECDEKLQIENAKKLKLEGKENGSEIESRDVGTANQGGNEGNEDVQQQGNRQGEDTVLSAELEG